MKASFEPYILKFKNPSGTSRGVLTEKLTYLFTLEEDGKEYVFKLREDVTFTDGEKFNAEAAKANFDAVLDNAERHTWLESVRLMKTVEKNGGKNGVRSNLF